MIGGASIKQYAHYGQNIRDRTFKRWDYGLLGNLIKYRRTTPPPYSLRRVTADVTMHYTVNDILLDERDVRAMAVVMRNAKIRKVGRRTFRHSDFVAAPDAKELVTDYIIKQLKRFKR